MPTNSDPSPELSFDRFAHLIPPIARHLAGQRPDHLDDLLQVGAIGLLRALAQADPARTHTFERYACSRIAGEMRHYLRDQAPLVRPPRELVELRGRVLAAQSALQQGEAREPSSAEIAAWSGLPVEKVDDVLLLESQGSPASLDQALELETGTQRYQLIDNRYSSFQLATDDRLMLDAALGRLRQASREVIEFAFYEDLTQMEIASRLGISQMQVSRRLRAAVGELWKVLNTKLF
ncbi:MAG: sigma-70 family RNA polymerase sigma factor [Candidatus Sericytochromatia bacterium]|nr:sigma-70 family RNA polymerase sigma factor [Candidatus Sericytochromatia bacterium]